MLIKHFSLSAYIGVLTVFCSATTWADTHYVRSNWTSPASPYTSWATAASNNIQAAVTAASDGDTVLVSNGTYTLTAQILIAKSNILQSVNGRDFTFINGNYRLTRASPCINTGTNQSWMEGAVDLDQTMRIRYGTVDMGAYEFIKEGIIFTAH